MSEFSTIQIALLFTALFIASKAVSASVYQACWRNAVGRSRLRHGSTCWLILRPLLWPVHAVAVGLTWWISWSDLAELRQTAFVFVSLMTWGAVFRFGAADCRRFFVWDRLLAILLCGGVFFSPAMLYPSLLVCCCLQYHVSASPLGPGYSNLLGFEFIRGSACSLLACIVFCGGWVWVADPPSDIASLFLVVVISIQGSHYLNHALAKAWLGNRWYSWILNNRIECLVINSYLRGWAGWLGCERVLKLAAKLRKIRVPLCASVWMLEFSFVAVVWDYRLAVILFFAATLFHIGVFVLTGLAELEYVFNHVSLISILLLSHSVAGTFAWSASLCAVTAINMLLVWVWVGLLRSKMLREYQQTGQSTNASLADPFDHLMAWWDSPYMRMFSYVVITQDGARYPFPVPKLSPYDTAVTDIHTHLMILNLYPGFDSQAEEDQAKYRTGVWGLVIDAGERDRLYALMDQEQPDLTVLAARKTHGVWIVTPESDTPVVAKHLLRLFNGFNHYRGSKWFRFFMRYPHFPGEDLAPDICPLLDNAAKHYELEQPITAVAIQRVKTFYTGEEIHLVEHSDVGLIQLSDRGSHDERLGI